MPEKMTATISYLQEAAKKLQQAAARLEAQDGWHHEHALYLIDSAINNEASLARRQIHRALAARHVRLNAESEGRGGLKDV